MAAVLGILYILFVVIKAILPTAIALVLSILVFKKLKKIKIEDDLFRE